MGTSGVAAVWGFHHYLKYHCFCHVSWDSDQLSLPEILPPVNITVTSADRSVAALTFLQVSTGISCYFSAAVWGRGGLSKFIYIMFLQMFTVYSNLQRNIGWGGRTAEWYVALLLLSNQCLAISPLNYIIFYTCIQEGLGSELSWDTLFLSEAFHDIP